MNVWKLSLENIKSKPIYTLTTLFTLTFSFSLLLIVNQLKSSIKYQTESNFGSIDMVIGSKGSHLQLILSSVLHLDTPTGNISYEEAKKIAKNPMIKTSIPISYGDNYKGYRIIGTTANFLNLYNAEINFGAENTNNLEVVIGHHVAKKLNLTIGDSFVSAHGLIENNIEVHNERFKVVGVLKQTYNVIDRLIITNLESIWDIHNHSEEELHNHDNQNHEEHHHSDKEITSLLVTFKSPTAFLTLPKQINKHTNLIAALPKYEIEKLSVFLGIGIKSLTWIAYCILAITGMIIFISLYKITKGRAFDLALLRTYGATNLQLIKIIIFECLILAFCSFIIGFLIATGLLSRIFNKNTSHHFNNIIQPLAHNDLLTTILLLSVVLIIATSIAIIPILKMNISTILNNEK